VRELSALIVCRCGARGDEGELVEHALSALSNPEDEREHGWAGEPQEVKDARAARQARETTRRKLAQVVGVTVDELRKALR